MRFRQIIFAGCFGRRNPPTLIMDTNKIRNFSIIAHIDHGKSTLADRMLEITKTVEARQMQNQYLDMMDLERERGITIKMQPVRMEYTPNSPRESAYILNLIDTPGHVDFSYEVSRSLAAVEGVVLLVDGTKGIQAQTLAHLYQAQKQKLVIIPAINKIDLPNSRPEEIELELRKILGEGEILKISAKEGTNVVQLLEAIIEKVPSPQAKGGPSLKDRPSGISRALIFDSTYDDYKGVLAFVRVFDGSFKTGNKIKFIAQKKDAEIMEVGYFKPQLISQKDLNQGEIGYIATGLKDPTLVRVGDTILSLNDAEHTRTHAENKNLSASSQHYSAYVLPGYSEPRPVVFASIFPKEGADFNVLREALNKLKLSDAALSFEPDSQEVLGRGYRCGFLGSLHMEIVLERLKREYNLASLIATTPSVVYELILKNGESETIFSAADVPTSDRYTEIREPWVALNILTPTRYLGGVLELVSWRRGVHTDTEYLSTERVQIKYEIPLAEIIVDFHDKLKGVSSGFASLSYEFLELRKGDLARLDILVAGELVTALSRLVPRDQAFEEGQRLVSKLKDLLPRELFKVSLQAAIGGKIVAREDISALKKDVTGYLYGGDITRKMKLREKQKRGKKRMKASGRVNIPSSVFFELLKR